MERFGWEQIVRRAELPPTTKLIALVLATFANPGGGRVRPGERLLADCCGHKERAVREHMAILREAGLIECVIEGTRGRASVYQLTIPGPAHDPVPMRLDPDGDLLSERPVGRRGSRRPITGTGAPVDNSMTGTPVPVDIADERHPGAGDPVNDRHPGAESPAPGRTITGTPTHDDRHPGASHHTDQPNQPRPTVETLAGYVTYADGQTAKTEQDHSQPPDIDPPPPDPGLTAARPAFATEPDDETEWRPRDTEFAEARRILDASPHREAALTTARMQLAAEGHDKPDFRALIMRAAAAITEGP